MLTQDKDEELALFREVRRREKSHRPTFLIGPYVFVYLSIPHVYLCVNILSAFIFFLFCFSFLAGSDHNSSTTAMSSQQYPLPRTAAENFLYSENEKSDYEW